ncbi:hypothetical protein B0H65DRAFT_324137 [Neurospora tetraspora]|uniref:Uncharacterized protein n=1 Tax=Neurospora tetraspora TaxID=94610 RepID=A0AAE0MND5_9PEZI|nr:hypothetical protein B0H65DRAFT_324137 [Neurospora tetraspora]
MTDHEEAEVKRRAAISQEGLPRGHGTCHSILPVTHDAPTDHEGAEVKPSAVISQKGRHDKKRACLEATLRNMDTCHSIFPRTDLQRLQTTKKQNSNHSRTAIRQKGRRNSASRLRFAIWHLPLHLRACLSPLKSGSEVFRAVFSECCLETSEHFSTEIAPQIPVLKFRVPLSICCQSSFIKLPNFRVQHSIPKELQNVSEPNSEFQDGPCNFSENHFRKPTSEGHFRGDKHALTLPKHSRTDREQAELKPLDHR